MWVSKVKINGSDSLIGKRAKKFNVSLLVYPLSSYETKKWIYRYFVAFISGDKDKIEEVIKDLKKDDRVVNIENKENFIIAQIKEPLKFKPIHHHKILHLEPLRIEADGSEFWTIGSWDKKELNAFIELYEHTHKGVLLKMGKKEISDFSIISSHPPLTNKQKEAIKLAMQNNYYDYPRKTSIQKLAEVSNLSFSTFHAHLRKAEQRLLPFLYGKAKKDDTYS